MGKMTLGRLSDDARLFFIIHLAHALSACGHQPPESGELALMRRQVVEALTIILPVRIPILSPAAVVKKKFLQAVFHSSSAVGRTSLEVMRNAVAIVSAGWWAMTLREN
jgi:hypothetical protein